MSTTNPRRLVYVSIDELTPADRNARLHDLPDLQAKMERFGFLDPIVVDERTGKIVGGHGRMETLQQARAAGLEAPEGIKVTKAGWFVPTMQGWSSKNDREAEAANIALNPSPNDPGFNQELLAEILGGLAKADQLEGTGHDADDLDALLAALAPAPEPEPGEPATPGPKLADRFLIPPFTVLDARQGWWQNRKREWLAIGIMSELGRGEGILFEAETVQDRDYYRHKEGTKRKPKPALNNDADPPTTQAKMGGRYADNVEAKGRLTWVAGDRPDGELDETSAKILGAGRRPPKKAAGPHPGGGGGGAWLGKKPGEASAPADPKYDRKSADGRSNVTGAPPLPEWATNGTEYIAAGTSIFDPVLCEITYRWFSGEGQHVLDPFAGGSVRGVVAGRLGRAYTGVELRSEQVDANRMQAEHLVPEQDVSWIVGDSREIPTLLPKKNAYDLVFTCPPYADLEVYSDDPADLSNMAYPDFLAGYRSIIAASVDRLRNNRFAVVVIGEARGKDGNYYGLVPDTIRAFQDAGMPLYNEAILVTSVGSLPLRTSRMFEGSRKLGKTHQNVLVFVKGDAKKAATAAGQVDLTFLDGLALTPVD